MEINFSKLRNINLGDRLIVSYDKLEQAGIIAWPVQAVALSYYCILGLVPFLALCFAVAKSFGLEQYLTSAIYKYFANFNGQDEVMMKVKGFADNLISNYSGGLMAFVALGLIFWSGYRILILLEALFGTIFGYHPPRRVIHRLMDYFAVIFIMPLLLVAGGMVNFYLTGLANATWDIPWGINPSGFFSIFLAVSPYLMWWLVLSWSYSYFSRGLIGWREQLLGGFITGVVFQVFQTFYLKIMFKLTDYNAIYSSFAAIPLFMIWLYLGWVIVLSGGELTRRLSDLFVTGRGFFKLVTPATWKNTVDLANSVLGVIIENYCQESKGGATSFRHLSRRLGEPLPALGAVINRLLALGLIARTSGPTIQEGPAFLPAKSPDLLTAERVRKILEDGPINIYN